ncbi:MAG: hypothetical protein KDA93_01620 [Planctomycetaceae bacterium]|nr:hypothetical protein [Planctomycetaceae bacterium]
MYHEETMGSSAISRREENRALTIQDPEMANEYRKASYKMIFELSVLAIMASWLTSSAEKALLAFILSALAQRGVLSWHDRLLCNLGIPNTGMACVFENVLARLVAFPVTLCAFRVVNGSFHGLESKLLIECFALLSTLILFEFLWEKEDSNLVDVSLEVNRSEAG